MPQGPMDATNVLNERFNAINGSDASNEGNMNMHGQNSGDLAMIAKCMVGDLFRYIRNWERQQQCHESEITLPETQDTILWRNLRQGNENAQILYVEYAIRNAIQALKRDIFQFLNTNGFTSQLGMGEGGGSRERRTRL